MLLANKKIMNINNTKVRVSYGTAIVLGLVKARQDVAPTTAYLLWDRGCIGQCTFCHRANGNERSKKLARITWPEFELKDIANKLTGSNSPFKRVCLQTCFNPELESDLEQIVEQLLSTGAIMSMTLSPTQSEFALKMLEKGVDHIGVGLDAACESTYSIHKKRNWQKDWPALKDLILKAQHKIEVHLIYGLGDSEEIFMKRIDKIVKLGGKVSLFALTPVNGGSQPEMRSYRRVQTFRYLCENKNISISDCSFSDGRLSGINVSKANLLALLNNGDAFRTSGCSDCNRPFYNESPGQEFYNFPRPLTSQEFEACVKSLTPELFID